MLFFINCVIVVNLKCDKVNCCHESYVNKLMMMFNFV